MRDEAGLRVRKRWARSDVPSRYRYSAESDYWSHGIGGSFGHRFWGDTAAVRLVAGAELRYDVLARPHARVRARAMSAVRVRSTSGSRASTTPRSCRPVSLAQVSYEIAYLDGFQGNLYRSVPNFGYEVVPEQAPAPTPSRRASRTTSRGPGPACSSSTATTGTCSRAARRRSWIPWALRAHTLEGRVYQQLTPDVEMRLLFRYHTPEPRARSGATTIAGPGLLPRPALYYSTDPKLGPVTRSTRS